MSQAEKVTQEQTWVTVTLRFRVDNLQTLQESLDDTLALSQNVSDRPNRAAEELITQLALSGTTGWLDLGLEC